MENQKFLSIKQAMINNVNHQSQPNFIEKLNSVKSSPKQKAVFRNLLFKEF